jgi:hypothetical protein
MNDLRCLPSDENLCPATPSRAPGSGLPRLHGLATAVPVVDAFALPRDSLRSPRELGSRPRAPLPAGSTLLRTSTSFADFCNRIRRTGTPDEPSILAREWSFRSATRRHQPMPVALALPMRCRTVGLRAATRTRRLSHVAFRLRGRSRSRAGALERRRARALDDVARALLVVSRAPGSPFRLFAGPG